MKRHLLYTKACVLSMFLVLSIIPLSASASATGPTNSSNTCVTALDGTSVVSGSFDLAAGGNVSVQERGWASATVKGRTYTRETYFGPAWTILATAAGTHYTFTFPTVSAELTHWRMPQGARIHMDSAAFAPVTLLYYTGACHPA